MSRRREPRVEVSLDVKIWGLDRYGNPFVHHARTVNATGSGARLMGIDCVNVGEVIGMQHGDTRSSVKVVWVGRANTPRAGHIGVHRVEPGSPFFPLDYTAMVGNKGRHRVTGLESGFESGQQTRVARSFMPPSRRKYPRYPCTGGVEIREQQISKPLWANLADVSLTGCYVETTSTLPPGTEVFFQVRARDLIIGGRAVIKTAHYAVGMGLAFLHLGAEDQQRLEFLVGSLAGGPEAQPHGETVVPARTPVPAMRTAVANTMNSPGSGNSGISAQIMRTITELNDLEQNLVKDKVDPRVIAQLHDAMEHTRQTAWTVQQWVDLNSSGGDPFQVLPQLEAGRMQMFLKLAHNLTADIDASSINEFSEGVQDLFESIQQLHRRLAKMFGGKAEDSAAGEKRTFGGKT